MQWRANYIPNNTLDCIQIFTVLKEILLSHAELPSKIALDVIIMGVLGHVLGVGTCGRKEMTESS